MLSLWGVPAENVRKMCFDGLLPSTAEIETIAEEMKNDASR